MKPMRHSIGNMVINSLASVLGLSWRSDRQCCGFICETENEKQEQLILLKPRLLMNVNGRSIAKTGNSRMDVQSIVQLWLIGSMQMSCACRNNYLNFAPGINSVEELLIKAQELFPW